MEQIQSDEAGPIDRPEYIGELFDSSYEGVKRLFAFAYDGTDNNTVTVNFHQNIYFQEYKLKITTLKLKEEIFMISQLMT